MDIEKYTESKAFLEPDYPLIDPSVLRFLSLKGRGICIKNFLKTLSVLPFALLYKVAKTFFVTCKLALSIALSVFTLGLSERVKRFFLNSLEKFGNEAYDWLVYPFAFLICILRQIFGILFHPRICFKV